MFRWGKKSDGFEWHKYVRTTIKLRREHRREQVHVAKDAALAQGKAAGLAAASFGSSAARLALAGARSALGSAWLMLIGATRAASMSAGRGAKRAVAALAPRLSRLHAKGLTGLLALAGAIGVALVVARLHSQGPEPAALAALAVALSALAVAGGAWLAGGSVVASWVAARLPAAAAPLGAMALLAVGIAGGLWAYRGGHLDMLAMPRLASNPFGSTNVIEGRASALSGDLLRVADTIVRLKGIEAPEREQRCVRPGNAKWRCGDAALEALQKLVRGKLVKCELSGSDPSGQPLGLCKDGAIDLAARLVREGHAFAQAGLFAAYAGLENEAQAAKAGLWRGTADRPADYRAKLWEMAKQKAPDGCPIKGQVTAAGRVYVLPWAPEYPAAKVQKTKGERWFCSETEAASAGWRAAGRS